MAPTISSKADTSSVLYEGRANASEIADIPGMSGNWKTRLEEAIRANGKTKRGVSLAAGMAPGYVHSIMKEGKDPTIDNLIKVCNAAGVSLYFVLYGVEMSPETEEIIKLLESSKAKRQGLLQILREKAGPEIAE